MVPRWIRQIFRRLKPATRPVCRRPARFGPRLEVLDERVCPSLVTAPSYPAVPGLTAAAVGDFNGDGKPDAAVLGPTGVSILVGDGQGALAGRIDVPGTAGGTRLAAGDFNGDGSLDLAVAGPGGAILLGNGNGTFQALAAPAPLLSANSVAAADFNGDGKLDLAFGSGGMAGIVPGNGDGNFGAIVTSAADPTTATNSLELTLAAGDFNGDGKADLAVVFGPSRQLIKTRTGSFFQESGPGHLVTFAGDGAGGLVWTGTGLAEPDSKSLALAAADFNGDGRADLAVPDSATGLVTLLAGQGDGSVLPAVERFVAGPGPVAAAAGDLNGDGKTDLVIAAQSSAAAFAPADSLDTLLGRGDLTFVAPTNVAAGPSPTELAVADFNGDGITDFATVGTSGSTVSIVLSNPDGSYRTPVTLSDGLLPVSLTDPWIVAGDLNRDGRADLVVTSGAGPQVATLLSNGDGTFSAPVVSATGAANSTSAFNSGGPEPGAMVLGHFFGNATEVDLAVANEGTGTVSLLPGNGFGGFAPGLTLQVGGVPDSLAAADVDGNGFDDLAVGTRFGGASLFMNPGHTLATVPTGGLPGFSGTTVAAGDFNGDGVPDFAVKAAGLLIPEVFFGSRGGVVIEPSSPNATVTPSGLEGRTLVVGDFNGDGILDLVGSGAPGGPATGLAVTKVWLGRGDGSFDPPLGYFAGNGSRAAAAADFNQDGLADVAVLDATDPGSVTVISGRGDDAANRAGAVGFQISAPAQVTAGAPFAVKVTAVDASGSPVAGYRGPVFLTSTDAKMAPVPFGYTFTAADAGTHLFTGLSLGSVGTQALNAAAPSLAAASASVQVFPTATHFAVTAPATATAGTSFAVTVAAQDNFGRTASLYTGTVHFSSSDLQAILPADYTFTTADAGVHTFNVTFKTAALTSLTAIATLGSVSGGATLPVVPAPASTFAVSGGGGPAGLEERVTVRAYDAFGNVATGYSGAIQFVSSDPLAVLPASSVVANGTGQDFVTLKTLGPQTLTATAATNPGLTGSETVAITPAVPASFVVTGFPGATAGVAQGFTVSVLDSLGNPTTNYTGTVGFRSSDPLASLPANYTFTAADAGVHAFTATLRTAGVQSLTALDVISFFNGVQSGIVVSPATAASLAVGGFPATTAGKAQAFTVTARDAFGNVATGYTGTVSFGSSDPQAGLPAAYTFTAADAGVHVFTAVLKTAGTQSLTVADAGSGGSLAATQSGIAVCPGAAASFAVAGFPATTAGLAQSFTVTARDAFGNVATGYAGMVSFGSSDPQAGLPAAYTFTSADAGTHTFTATLDTAGTQSLSTIDAAAGLAGSQSGIAVRAAAAASLSVTGFPATTAGVAQTVTVTAYDRFGNVATGYAGTVSFSSSDAQAGLPAAYTFTAADAGVHVFTAALKTAGTQSLSAADGLGTLAGTQAGIAVSPAAAATFTVAGFPATTAGVAHGFTVTARDAFGNVATGYAGTVTFRSSDVQAGLPAGYTFTAADAGVHTFSATLKTAGSQSVTVTDTANAAIVGSQSGIAVSAAAAAQFLLVVPAAATQGVGFTFTVKVLDAYGNVVTGYRGKVHLSSTDAKAGTQDYTFSSSDNGIHVFSYTFSTLGLQTLTITDTSNSAITGRAVVNVVAKTSGGGH